jgi:lectin-like protein
MGSANSWAVPLMALSLVAAFASRGNAGPLVSGPGGHQYEVVSGTDVSWDQAEAAAKADGGFLATIGDASEQSFVEKLLSDGNAPSGAYWFGLRESGSEGDYRHLSGAKPGYTHWLVGQPDNFGGNENSGSILWSNAGDATVSRRGFWNDLPPSTGYPQVAGVYPDLVPHGYLVEFAGTGAGAAFNNGDGDNQLAGDNTNEGGTPNSAPLPLASSAFPLGALMAAAAARRLGRRRRV